jgi:hypothetical protein
VSDACLPIALSIALSPLGATAQQGVLGTLADAESGTPIEGAMVVLLSGGQIAGRVLTDAEGSFRIGAPQPGRYELRVDRIGYASTLSGAFEVAAGQMVEHAIRTSVEPIGLEGIGVVGSGRCDARTSAMLTLRAVDPARGRATCRPTLYLDGVPARQPDADEGDATVQFDLGTIGPDDIVGIEVYRSPAETPAPFAAHSGACGVIVIWTG